MIKQIIDECLMDTVGVDVDDEIIQYILEGFNVISQTHIYHLVTKSHSEHLAINEFYDGLQSLVDSIAEKALGLDICINTKSHNNVLTFNYKKSDLITLVNGYRGTTTSLIALTNTDSMMSINDDLIGIQTAIDKLSYKLKLK